MVVKERRGRRRYIAFRTGRSVPTEELLAALNSIFALRGVRTPKLIQFDGSMGIVRCSHGDKEAVIEALAQRGGGDLPIITLSTSGTLRTLRERYFPNKGRTD
jgi:RNase P/RNase MRP subunit POP5